MRNFFKLLEAMRSIAIIVMVAVIGFSMAGCVFEDPNGGNSGKTVDRIEIGNMPAKSRYYVGDTFDPTGLTVQVFYSDGSSEIITSGYTWTTDMSTRGRKPISVKHTASGVTSNQSLPTIDVYPTEDWTQTDFYGTWKSSSGSETVTISANSVVINTETYTISNWAEITKIDGFPNLFTADITNSGGYDNSFSVKLLRGARSYDGDFLIVRYGATTNVNPNSGTVINDLIKQ